MADLEKLAKGCDLLVIPAVPSKLDIEALKLTLAALRKVRTEQYRILLTKLPPPPQNDGEILRDMLKAAKAPLFKAEIPLLKSIEKAAAQGVPVSEVHDPRAARAWDTVLIRIDTHDRAIEKLRKATAKPDFGEYVERLILQDFGNDLRYL